MKSSFSSWTGVMQHDQYDDWLEQPIKPCKLNESVIAITNTSCVCLLTCVWVFCFLNRCRVGILRRACSWNLHQRHFFKKMLFSDVISFDSCIFHNPGMISADISKNLKSEKFTSFFSSQLTSEKRSLFQDLTWSFLFINPGL